MTVVVQPEVVMVSRVREIVAHLAFSGRTAAEAVAHNKLRAGLTALGILFGVASVIAMLAIGNGAEHDVIEQIKLLGANNIVVTPIVEQTEGKVEEKGPKQQTKKFTPGLTALDAAAIATLPDVEATSSEVVINSVVTRAGHSRSGKLVGVDSNYFRVMNLHVQDGTAFDARHFRTAEPVAIIGQGVKSRFFVTADPIGQSIKVGTEWLTIVGVLENRSPVSLETAKRLGIRDVNMDIYIPLPAMLLRYRNRGEVTQAEMQAAAHASTATDDSMETDDARAERRNYHQLDKVIVQVGQSNAVSAVSDVVRRMLQRRHNDVIDFEISVPELLLKQEEDTKRIFNIVLGAIASISLVVGGIGIMNIMLASILERMKEIGVRRAMGATRKDVLWQFLTEAIMISLAGGITGIVLGALFSVVIARIAHVNTIISPASVVVAFGVSVAVGLVFGIVPAHRAAKQDPILCLRYE